MGLDGQVVLVTGAARRVGRAIATTLADAGARIVVHYHSSAAEAGEVVEVIEAGGREAMALRADLTQVREIEGLVAEVVDRLGRLDILVNSASAFFATPFGATTEEAWDELLGVNLKGPFFLSQLAAAAMTLVGGGQIINIADSAVERPWTNHLPYAVAKAALVSLTRGLARALAPRIRVNAVAPGPVLAPEGTGLAELDRLAATTLMGRVGSPDDVAGAVRFLVEQAPYVTGAVIPVDGGRHLA